MLADARRFPGLAKAADAAFEKVPKDDDLRGAAGTVVDAFRAHSAPSTVCSRRSRAAT
ncbi:hypothetical protein [Burkholderia plantarii]|uniref:hypothetical protein n=1 Tax=Burkholderia plantarii TaxID=41899 RepID=UPI0018DB11F2|nr:hypothetical protein [Burkholderia plantarii]MBI0331768.1 hypothetical protein [Burkholderia plantarii]